VYGATHRQGLVQILAGWLRVGFGLAPSRSELLPCLGLVPSQSWPHHNTSTTQPPPSQPMHTVANQPSAMP
jgi:hypothetical protein